MRIACGAQHSLAVSERLELLAWGGNYHGQVGDGSKLDQKLPVTIFKDKIKACAAGKATSLAVTTAGEVYAWGNNDDCLLGTGWKTKQDVPVLIPIEGCAKGIKAVSAGWKHCLALSEDGEVFAWGGNEYGQLGDGSRAPRRRPVKMIGGNVTAIASGWYHNLALTDTGDVWTWGFTSQDQHTGVQHILQPVLVINGGIQAIACGSTHSLALTVDGDVLAWGGNDYGQLGDGTQSRRMTPVTVAMNCIQIAAGSYHSIAVDANTNVLQWGFSMDHTSYGDGHTWLNLLSPEKVEVEGGVFGVTAGGVHNLAISHNGEVIAWGGNSCGQIGDKSLKDRQVPKHVLPAGTMETIPLDDVIAKLLKGPAEMAAREAEEHRNEHRAKYAERSITPTRHSEYGVPELLQSIAGQRPRKGAALGATYPLCFNGSMRPLGKTASRSTGTLGFVPGTGFRPGSFGNTMQTMSWPEGPGTHNPNRRRRSTALALMGNRTDPLALQSGAQSSQLRALPAAAATDGFQMRSPKLALESGTPPHRSSSKLSALAVQVQQTCEAVVGTVNTAAYSDGFSKRGSISLSGMSPPMSPLMSPSSPGGRRKIAPVAEPEEFVPDLWKPYRTPLAEGSRQGQMPL